MRRKGFLNPLKKKCKDKRVDHPLEVRAHLIQTNPAELCAAIQHLSWLARELPRGSYEQSLKKLLESQRDSNLQAYHHTVTQLAYVVLSRHGESQEHIQQLLFKALRMQTAQNEQRYNQPEDEARMKDLNKEPHSEHDQLQVLFENSQRDLEGVTRMFNHRQRIADLEIQNGQLRQGMMDRQIRISQLEADNALLKGRAREEHAVRKNRGVFAYLSCCCGK